MARVWVSARLRLARFALLVSHVTRRRYSMFVESMTRHVFTVLLVSTCIVNHDPDWPVQLLMRPPWWLCCALMVCGFSGIALKVRVCERDPPPSTITMPMSSTGRDPPNAYVFRPNDGPVNPHVYVFGVEFTRSRGDWNDAMLAQRSMHLPPKTVPLSNGFGRTVASLVQTALFFPRIQAHRPSCTNDSRNHRRVR